ncbi:MAG: TetR family transcriptional regulator [Myxococcales bacterium]|nr:TetR family transcriptional regulator [Myxococcales bacterium]
MQRPRKRPRQARSRATVEAIVEATARVLAQHGYEKATTNRVAKVAGVSVGSLYQYFPNKEALIGALVDRHFERMRALFAERLAAVADAPVPVAARALIDAVMEGHRRNPQLHQAVLESVPRLGVQAQRDAFDAFAVPLIAGYMARRRADLRPPDLELAAWVLMRTLQPLVHAAVLRGPAFVEDTAFVDEATALVVGYLSRG